MKRQYDVEKYETKWSPAEEPYNVFKSTPQKTIGHKIAYRFVRPITKYKSF